MTTPQDERPSAPLPAPTSWADVALVAVVALATVGLCAICTFGGLLR